MKKIILIALFLFIEMAVAMAGNPIMGIRCRGIGGDAVALNSDQVASDVETFTPDCSGAAACSDSGSDCSENVFWNTSTLACGCDVVPDAPGVAEERSFFSACGCPEGLGDEDGYPVFTSEFDDEDSDSGSGSPEFLSCIPYENCFDGEIAFVLAPLTCDLPAGEDTIRVTITDALGGPLPAGAFVTLQSLINCDLIDEDDVALLALLDQFDGDESAAFQADGDGVILIEFTRELKTEPSTLDFGDYGSITIPGCPELDAVDPCSCNADNIVDANGTVLFWYDELTLIIDPDSTLKLQANNNLQGFLMPSPLPTVAVSNPFITDPEQLFFPDPAGEVNIPYYRDANASTINIEYSYSGGTAPTIFTETCDLEPTACNTPIPTIGEWGLMIMGLLLLIIGVISFQFKGRTLIPVKERVKRNRK